MMRDMAVDPPCPCGLPARLHACCGRWHAGALHLQAPDAAALMRSRYSAYVLKLGDYLRDTWHPSTRPATLDFDPAQRWMGLQVLRHTVQRADHATVAFIARWRLAGRPGQMAETSRFVCEGGRWFYLDGDVSGHISSDAAGD
jgi:SEC-C motif-containing protein